MRRLAGPADLDILPPVFAAGESEDVIMGRQLTAQWAKVVGGQREQLVFGAMMLKLRAFLTAHAPSKHEGSGRHAKGSGMKGWLETHAPEISERTASRLMEIAEGVQELCKLGKKVDLEALLAGSVQDLPEKLRKKREEIEKLIEGKSQRQLLLEFGGAEGKGRGGNTADKKRKLSPEEEEAEMEATLRADALSTFEGLGHLGPKYRILADAEIETAAELLEAKAAELRTWLKTPKSKRPVLDKVQALLGEDSK